MRSMTGSPPGRRSAVHASLPAKKVTALLRQTHKPAPTDSEQSGELPLSSYERRYHRGQPPQYLTRYGVLWTLSRPFTSVASSRTVTALRPPVQPYRSSLLKHPRVIYASSLWLHGISRRNTYCERSWLLSPSAWSASIFCNALRTARSASD